MSPGYRLIGMLFKVPKQVNKRNKNLKKINIMKLMKRRNGDLFPSLTNDFFDDGFLWPGMLNSGSTLLDRGFSMPPANISETKEEFRVDLSAPGLSKSDFKIEVEDGTLTISSEKQEESKDDTENYKRREFSYSSFCRSFELPENVKEDKINAKYENGMLHVSLPKKEISVSKPKKEIEVA
jgi:HSP20 family protein